MQQGLERCHLHHARCADRTDVAKACSTEIRGFFTRGAAVEKATKQNLHVEIPETKSTTATLKDHAEGGVRTASIGSGKLCPSRPHWVAERQGGEAHHPVLANCKAGSAPNDREGDRGEVEKIQEVGARRPGRRVGFAIVVRNFHLSNDFNWLDGEL
jgi:hypothetical protein